MSDTEYTADVNVTEDITPDVDGGNATSSAVDMDEILLSADVSPDELIDVELYSDEPINTDVRDTVGSSETDHRLLTHRDAPDQHPMTAITGLNTSLQNMAASIDSRLTADENGIILLQVETDGHTQRLNVVEDDVVDAAKTATNYVTALSSTGIKLHAEDSATLNYITLDGTNGMKVYNGGQDVSSFGSSVRVGRESGSHVSITNSGLEILNGAESAAMFGDITRIGHTDEAHLNFDATGMRGYSPSGEPYFSINNGTLGTTFVYEWLSSRYGESIITPATATSTSYERFYFQQSQAVDNVSESVYNKYTALPTGGRFNIRAVFYAERKKRSDGSDKKIVPYSIVVNELEKGTSQAHLSGTCISYNCNMLYTADYVSIYFEDSGAPSPPSGDPTYVYTFYGFQAMYGSEQTGYFPFYRFGKDVAETGGAYSFVMGTGTKADTNNALALGEYNDSPNDAVLMVGRGTSDSVRANALTLYKTGDITIAGSLTQASDRRLKEHVNYLSEDAVAFVRALKPVHFIKGDKHHTGFYAQDVESADVWHCMTGEMNGFKTLGYSELIAPLVAYCQSLEKRIEELERN